MAVQCKNGDVTFDKTATTATNPDSIPVGTAVPGELPGELSVRRVIGIGVQVPSRRSVGESRRPIAKSQETASQ